MRESESGFWFVVKNYPGIVREGLRLTTDGPTVPKLRVDPDGERKHAEHVRAQESLDVVATTGKMPPQTHLTIYLQWIDRSYEPAWRDTSIVIDRAARRVLKIDGWLLGRRHEGSGAIGVFIFASPALALLSPYILTRNAAWRARERKEGMSRHAIVLMERLKGQLDRETETLLREALKNEWAHDRKMTRRVSFAEARDLLSECTLAVGTYGRPDRHPRGESRVWTDADGDVVASAEFSAGDPNPPKILVLGSTFEGDDVRILKDVCLARTDERESSDS